MSLLFNFKMQETVNIKQPSKTRGNKGEMVPLSRPSVSERSLILDLSRLRLFVSGDNSSV